MRQANWSPCGWRKTMETFRLNTFFLLINYFLSDCTQIVFLTELLKRFHKDAVPRHHYYYHLSATYLSKNIFYRKKRKEWNERMDKQRNAQHRYRHRSCTMLISERMRVHYKWTNGQFKQANLTADVSASSLHHSQGKVSKCCEDLISIVSAN